MKRPQVTLKLATSLDGRIATGAGESRWITGEAARAEVQKLRAAHDAVLIGSGTARADDPELLARTTPPPLRQPVRVVLDTEFSLAPLGRLFATLDRATLLVIGAGDGDEARRKALEDAGARTAVVARGPLGVDADAALAAMVGMVWSACCVRAAGNSRLRLSLRKLSIGWNGFVRRSCWAAKGGQVSRH
jgi:diaminohydroxyphosphoribosylaminopyrimidine deaminase/5-amino-6-(5-phosphoribosylamino)uracil reductase